MTKTKSTHFVQRIDEAVENTDDDSDEESQITAQDIIFIQKAKRAGFDSITISNVHKASHITELRDIIGPDSGKIHIFILGIRIILRVTTTKAV